METIFGIDLGAQMAGTTVISYNREGALHLIQSKKKSRADDLILELTSEHQPELVFMDAPISLPAAYTDPSSNEFMYREADRLLRAMSPMFLGGLTARAMQLAKHIRTAGITCMETYPKALMQELFDDQEGYKQRLDYLEAWNERLLPMLPLSCSTEPRNWHQFDAVLCWYSGYRWLKQMHRSFGNESEGVITI